MKPTIECGDCDWQGNREDLIPFLDGLDPEFCPECGSSNMMDITKGEKIMAKCEICGTPRENDLFSAVTGEKVCSICKLKFIGGLSTNSRLIDAARARLGLSEGEYLVQDNPKEAAKILGRR